MNVTALALDIMDKTAQPVSLIKPNQINRNNLKSDDLLMILPLDLFFFSRIPHLGQNYSEAFTQHSPLSSDTLQGILEHHQQCLISARWHHEICADM